MQSIDDLISEIRNISPRLSFEILEIGAVPTMSAPEPFHRLLDDFPDTRIHAFELDPESHLKLSSEAKPGVLIHKYAIGSQFERRDVFLTNHPMCTSLYRPNESVLREFQNLEVAYLRETATVQTNSLDDLLESNVISSADFVKIDIQGAELDAFMGARKSLEKAVCIVSEVEFFHHYENQPLFGDVDKELRSQGFMFHKFLQLNGRSLRPAIINNDPNYASWHLWTDAMFLRDFRSWPSLDTDALLKLSVIGLIYGSPDVSLRCLRLCDQIVGSNLAGILLSKNL